MAQSGSCSNPDLSNAAIAHSPDAVSTDLDTQKGREDEEGEEEDEEVELAEEVGEDILTMAEAGDGLRKGDGDEQGEMALLPNGVIPEGEGGSETLEENRGEGVELLDEEHQTINEESNEKQSRIKDGKDHTVDNYKEKEDKLEKPDAMTACSETLVRVEELNGEDNELEEHGIVSTADYAETLRESSIPEEESAKPTQLSNNDTTTTEVVSPAITEVVIPFANNEDTENVENPTTYVTDNTGTEQDTIQNDLCQTTGTIIEVGNQTNQLVSENQDAMKNSDEKDNSESSKQEVGSTNNNISGKQKDSVVANNKEEGNKECVKDTVPTCDGVVDTEDQANLKAKELVFVPSEGQAQTEGGVEETVLGGIKQKYLEDEQVDQVEVLNLDKGGATMEETVGCVGRELVGEEDHQADRERENQTLEGPLEPVVPCVEEVPPDAQQDVDIDQVEEAFELEEGGEVEQHEPEGERESTTQGGGELQEHPSQLLTEAGPDWGEKLREQPIQMVPMKDRMEVEAGEDTMVGEVEMAEEPVTVLDDEIEEIEDNQTSEQKAGIVSEDNKMETKNADLEGEKVDMYKKDDNRELELDINGRVKGLKKAMENGMLSPEPQPLRKEGWGTAKILSPRRKDTDWIKSDQSEKAPEMKDWRKELKPIKKDMWETERGTKEEVVKKEPEKKSQPRREDWIRELKSVIKEESLPKKKDEQVKKKRVVLFEDGRSYMPQRDEMTEGKREEVKLISHRRVESPLPPVRRNSRTPQDQEYEVSLYVKVTQ